MKRSMQEVVELVIFALIALLVGTGVVWLAGWLLGLVGTVLTWLAGLVWSLLRFLVPIAVVAGAVYLLVKLMNRSAEQVAGEPQVQPATPPSPQTKAREEAAARAAAGEASVPAPDAGAKPSTPDAPTPPATNRWEGEGGSVTTDAEADEQVGDGRDRRDEADDVRSDGDDAGAGGDDTDDERRHGGGPG